MTKILWHRVIMFLAVCALVVVGSSVLLAESANAYEDAHSLPIPVLTLLAEAGGEGFDGMVAVGNVIRNRAAKRGLTVDEVCLQHLQFSCWNDKGLTVYRYAGRNRAIWQDALTAWQVSGTEDITGGADLYHADYVKPNWNWSKTVKTVKVGKHIFYREIK